MTPRSPHPASRLVLPVFVREGIREPAPIASMPGVVQHTLDSVRRAAADAAALGLGGIMLFGVPTLRDANGSRASDPGGILNVAARAVTLEVGDALLVQTDLCLDAFTDHGHCGIVAPDGEIDLDATLVRYREIGISQAEAGSRMLGLSGMMAGQVAAVRGALASEGRSDVAILAYSAKYASALYGPFRDAVESTYAGGPRSYQLDPADGPSGIERARVDVSEGADVVMVKPAGGYLDVLAGIAAESRVPVWAYQVSGEYTMVEAAAARGWLDRRRTVEESIVGIRRAGADGVLTYWASDLARWWRDEGDA